MNLAKLFRIVKKAAPVVIANAPMIIAVVKQVKKEVKRPRP
jgi:hypothetical protein